MKVPLFDMTRQYKEIRERVLDSIDKAFSSGQVILGENVKNLESGIQNYMNVSQAIGVANGSDALVIAVKALDIGEGDYVITTPYTFFATASCITRNGAIPIFVDVEPKYYNIDLNKVEDVLKNHPKKDKIKAIIPVHLFGKTVDIDRLMELSEKYNVKIIEDTAQAIGAVWYSKDGRKVFAGTAGDIGTISFFPTKNLGAYGDAGMIVSNDEALAVRCRKLRGHGAAKKYYHDEVGFNSRLDEVQAAILNIKLEHLDEWIERRIEIAETYKNLFIKYNLEDKIEYPEVFKDHTHVYHQYVTTLKAGRRDELAEFLKTNGVETIVYYPKNLHAQKCFEYLGYKEGDFPVADEATTKTLALPMFPELTKEEQEYVVQKISEYYKK